MSDIDVALDLLRESDLDAADEEFFAADGGLGDAVGAASALAFRTVLAVSLWSAGVWGSAAKQTESSLEHLLALEFPVEERLPRRLR